MLNVSFPKYLLCLPAILLIILIYPIGINTFLLTHEYRSYEIDAPGPAMQLDDISRGFNRDNPGRSYPIFHSMVMSSAYIPYIWARTSVLPPYDLNMLDAKLPSLKSELVILSRFMNIMAALGILVVSFYIMLLLYKDYLFAFLVSLAIALNPNLMFQSSVTYYENWSIFWVMLSALCFVKVILNRKNVFLWFSGFFIIAALAVSAHERMSGYYIFSAPFLIYKFYTAERASRKMLGRKTLLMLIALVFAAITFCLANSVFRDGFGPVAEYIRFKSPTIKSSPDRTNGLFGLLKNQLRCHSHTIWLVFWNLGGILPFFSLYGLVESWKRRFYPALALLLFPMGYQALSVGLPGWTSGRYILGQAIFAILFAGFGVSYLLASAKNRDKAKSVLLIFTAALILEFFMLAMVKVADIYYHPDRVLEAVLKDPASRGRKIAIQGIVIPSKDDLERRYNVKCDLLSEEEKICPGADIIISTDKDGCSCRSIRKELFRKPPAWLIFLVRRQCYLYSQGVSAIRVQWCDSGR